MAGRGCTISIKLLGGSNGAGETEDISLPVALHSPLLVLKEQLETIVSIHPSAQVLILCDLTDPERNSDVLLTGRDHLSLHDCGISNGSVLTLHALGLSAEKKQKMMLEAFTSNIKVDAGENKTVQREIFALDTPITAAQANHSYNGVIFDVMSQGPYEIDLISVSLAGMLGRVRIFARNQPWEDPAPTRTSNHWWAHRDSVSQVGWELIADINCRPSWDKPIEIKFNKPVKLLPHQKRGLYCHSSLPDDLGIQYQSYSKHSVIAQDEFIQLLPGLGHTGSEPFDDVHGWYRSYRGLAGSIRYHRRWKGWSPFEHQIFPRALRRAVFTMLLAQNRRYQEIFSSSSSSANSEVPPESIESPNVISTIPAYVVYNIMEFAHFDWFDGVNDGTAENKTASREVSQKNNAVRRFLAAMFRHFGGNINISQLLYHLGGTNGIEFDGEQITVDDLLGYEQENDHIVGSDDEEEEEDDDEYDESVYEEEEDNEEEEELLQDDSSTDHNYQDIRNTAAFDSVEEASESDQSSSDDDEGDQSENYMSMEEIESEEDR